MTQPEPYLIVTHLPGRWRDRHVPRHRPGRHRWRPDTARNVRRPHPHRPLSPRLRRRGRHRRRPDRPVLAACQQVGIVTTLVMLLVSGWFTASGATAVGPAPVR